MVHEILEDDEGRLWMNSNRGIFWVRRDELNAFAEHRIPRIHSTAYTERDGLRNREGNGGFQPAGAKTRDGRLWFPTQDGIVGVDPSRVTQGGEPPPVTVEQVTSRGRVLSADTSTLALSPTERDLEITYTALTFVEPGNVRFRYRLEPYDPDWVDAGSAVAPRSILESLRVTTPSRWSPARVAIAGLRRKPRCSSASPRCSGRPLRPRSCSRSPSRCSARWPISGESGASGSGRWS